MLYQQIQKSDDLIYLAQTKRCDYYGCEIYRNLLHLPVLYRYLPIHHSEARGSGIARQVTLRRMDRYLVLPNDE
jgi:hypothetical protein